MTTNDRSSLEEWKKSDKQKALWIEAQVLPYLLRYGRRALKPVVQFGAFNIHIYGMFAHIYDAGGRKLAVRKI